MYNFYVYKFVELSLCFYQESANHGSCAKCSLLPVFINQLHGNSHAHLFSYYLYLLSAHNSRVNTAVSLASPFFICLGIHFTLFCVGLFIKKGHHVLLFLKILLVLFHFSWTQSRASWKRVWEVIFLRPCMPEYAFYLTFVFH